MGWNNKNCCCEPKTYTCDTGEVNICCMTLQVSTWAHDVTFYALGHDPDDVCGYVSSPFYHNNICGRLTSRICGFTASVIYWGIRPDGTVRLVMSIQSQSHTDGSYIYSVNHVVEGLDPETWYLSPITFTLSGVDYTLSLCPDPHVPFPEWPITPVYLQVTSESLVSRASGNVLCGRACAYFDLTYLHLSWRYVILTDEIIIDVTSGLRAGTLIVDYDDGNWINNTHTVTLVVYIGGTGPDTTATVTLSDSCDIPPPPAPCEVSNACFPDGCPCITLGDTGELYRDLMADVSGPVTHTGLVLDPDNVAPGWDYNSGSDSIAIRCIGGGLDPYYVAAVFGGVNYFFAIPAGGIDCDPDDDSQILDITLTDGVITIRIYTL